MLLPAGFSCLVSLLSQPDRESRGGYTGRGLGFATSFFLWLFFDLLPLEIGVLRAQSTSSG